jgi:hypothetical protein
MLFDLSICQLQALPAPPMAPALSVLGFCTSGLELEPAVDIAVAVGSGLAPLDDSLPNTCSKVMTLSPGWQQSVASPQHQIELFAVPSHGGRRGVISCLPWQNLEHFLGLFGCE